MTAVPASYGDNARLRLKAAVLKDFPPQYSTSPSGQPQGFAIDTILAVARLADADIDFVVKDSWDDVFEAVRTGEADLIPNQGITERRKAWFAFTYPVETFSVRIFVRQASSDIRSMADLAGRKVGVVRLNVGETPLKDKPNIDLVVYAHIQGALFDLLAGSVDAIVFPEPVIRLLARRAGIEDRVKAVGPPLVEIKRAISVRKGNTILLRRLNAAVAKFVGSPSYETIYTRWYGEPPPLITTRQLVAVMVAILVLVVITMALWRYRSLKRINLDLARNVEERLKAEKALQEAHDQLEQRVRERTRELMDANRDLADSQRQLADIIEFLPDPTWVIDVDGRVIAWNRAIERMTGIAKEEMLGRGDYAYAVPLYGEPRPTLIDLVLQRNERWESDYLSFKELDGLLIASESFHPVMGEDGRYLSGTAGCLYDAQGHVAGAIETVRDITATKHLEHERERLITELKTALDQVRTLSGLLPICASCKKIRDDGGYWNQIESFVSQHSEAEFSHSICPDCARKLYPDLDL